MKVRNKKILKIKILNYFFFLKVNGFINNQIKENIIYEHQKTFYTYIYSEHIEEYYKQIPNDLQKKDINTILNFFNSLEKKQNITIKIEFFKDNNQTFLKNITIEENSTKQKEEEILVQTTNLEKHKKKIEGSFKEVINDKKKYEVYSLKEKNIEDFLFDADEKNQIKSLLNLIKIYKYNSMEFNKELNIKLIFSLNKKERKLIAIQIIQEKEKINFYLFSNQLKENSKVILVDEKGNIIPGKLLELSKNKLPVIKGVLGSKFGYRKDPFSRKKKFHSGQDIRAPFGSEIFSMGEGVVIFADYNKGYGYVILIYHNNKVGEGYSTLYGHCSKVIVKKGQRVKQGELIGYVGSTGRSTGPHVHYEVIDNKTKERVDPLGSYTLFKSMIPVSIVPFFLKQKQLVKNLLKKSN